jgi:hypothetical protein
MQVKERLACADEVIESLITTLSTPPFAVHDSANGLSSDIDGIQGNP